MSRHWSPARIAAGLVLASWAGLFWFVLVSDRTGLYLSSRTGWLVPIGAMLMTVAAFGRLASARVKRRERLSVREAGMLGVVALPVVILLALPPATLGSFSAGRRAQSAAIGASARIVDGPIDFVDIAAARSVRSAFVDLRSRAGEQVTLEGIVTVEAGESDRFQLTRFVITCCVADATISYVTVVDAPPGRFADDDWVRVTGTIYPLGADILIDADGVEPVPPPEDPYLTP